MDDRVRAIVVAPDETVGAALRRMDASGGRVVVVCAPDGTLLGIATDGDMRRWILAGKSLDDRLEAAMNKAPFTVAEDWTRAHLERLMAERRFEFIPVVDEGGHLVDAVWWHDFMEGTPKAPHEHLGLPVVIMAGGKGTRLAPFTNVLPKPLVPIGDKPITQHIMERFAGWGCGSFYLMLNHKANLVRAFFDDLEAPYRVTSVIEPEPLGTAGALSLLAGQLDGTFFLTNCDVLIDANYGDLLRFHRASGADITLVASMKHFSIPYGVCEMGEGGQLTGMTEKPSFDRFVATGMYVIESAVLADVPRDVPFHMTDLIGSYLERQRTVAVYPVREGSWLDMGALDEMKNMLERLGHGDRG